MNIPLRLERAWEVLRRGKEVKIDLPLVEFSVAGKKERRYFIQLAGAGLDARAIELVSWKLKKQAGPLAYVLAGFQALAERQAKTTVRVDGKVFQGELVLAGNGKFYGGSIAVFPEADLANGWLDICILPQVNLGTLLRFAPDFLLHRRLPERHVKRIRAQKFEWLSDSKVAFELDGEWIGHLPATFSIEPGRLRVAAP
jgi:diacylglycerol kinase family enzyme